MRTFQRTVPTVVFAAIAIVSGYCGAPAATDTPNFDDYPVATVYQGKIAAPILSTSELKQYATRIKNAAKGKVNFAGQFILTAWGCGSECLMGAVLDAKSGKVALIPFTICCWGAVDEKFNPIEYRLKSRLIVFSGLRNEEGKDGAHLYLFDSGRFVFLRTIEK
jgi:hypothetical protein